MADKPECTWLSSESGRGMDAAFYAMRAIVDRNAAMFANVETAMAEHGVLEAQIGALRVTRSSEISRLQELVADMYLACKEGYGNDAMSKAVDELGLPFLESYERSTGEIGGEG